jgi:hypothetical protein
MNISNGFFNPLRVVINCMSAIYSASAALISSGVMTENRQLCQRGLHYTRKEAFIRLQSTASCSIGIAPSDPLLPEPKIVGNAGSYAFAEDSKYNAAMLRELVWIDQPRFRGWGVPNVHGS